MTREELKENICGMTYDEMFEYIYSLESKITDDLEPQLLKKDIEISKLQGELKAYTKEIKRVHPTHCRCMICLAKDKS